MEEQTLFGKIIRHPLVEEIKRSYLDYAMSVIVGRALPDARDGLKPVQRRILFAMQELGLRHNQSYKKSARVVGETMGKYHPHGDSAIYDTMVRLAQNFSMRYTLVDGQGNFGSIDGDSAAAMRYTEARLQELGELMLQDIDEDTVEWGPNFDESLKEPMVLPSQVPNLLVNGSTGIAVGMATNMPPHNLGEVVDAICYLIEAGDQAEFGELMARMPGPDFPTGGIILGKDGIIDAYRTGRGRLVVQGLVHVEEGKRGKSSVVITEIPYMVNKTTMIETIASCVQNKTIDGVTDIRDESDRKGLRVVLEVSRDVDPELVIRQLYRRSQLQNTFGVINLALVDGRPVELSLTDMLNVFLGHRRTVVRRRTEFRLKKAEARAHILEGLVKALDVIDRVIALIRGSDNAALAKERLVAELDFTEIQAQAILDMKLQRLTGLERDKLNDEFAGLLADIQRYRSILDSEKVLDGVIVEELVALKGKYGDDRRTKIVDRVGQDCSDEDLIPREDIVVMLSRDGYLRRVPLEDYSLQAKGGKGRRGARLREEDEVSLMGVSTTHDDIFLFTTKGRVFAIKGYIISESRTGKGKLIGKYISLENDERVVSMKTRRGQEAGFLFFLTRRGIAKRLPSSELDNLTRAGRRVVTLDEGDEIAQILPTSGMDDLLLVSAMGQALRVSEDEFRPMGRSARGVKAMRLKDGDRIISGEVVTEDRRPILVSETGIGKRTNFEDFTVHHRGGGGMKVMTINSRTGLLAAATSVSEDDEIIVMTAKGRMIRVAAKEIRVLGRTAAGSIVVRLDGGDSVVDLSVVNMDGEDLE
ncbi:MULTISPECIES: DNA gyrase subunit A [Dethiosulfovibrio]|uniref:DNA gyrase subunit A n=2 Tax=Dethiosulfovibrio TaxID=47054 RepID=A0ABS9ENU1_9BACT|nr:MULTISPECIES: DNA gyrase subunit A [Dethiosulfovibrio]MCF4114627.1 DNA gyrase subunit A [Dethiosulfovibrio russensis]MCF4142851.1 DNA gyrase subunit A [Dethiosulfovibrio marinus]MCF4144820.1 DNA gyrase subunit A [Dethiosulfovibrio acidaminovorans]